jgi:hypothetical protein
MRHPKLCTAPGLSGEFVYLDCAVPKGTGHREKSDRSQNAIMKPGKRQQQ